MNSQQVRLNYGGMVLLITLLAGIGAVLSFPYWTLRSGQKLMPTSSANTYQIEWLGV